MRWVTKPVHPSAPGLEATSQIEKNTTNEGQDSTGVKESPVALQHYDFSHICCKVVFGKLTSFGRIQNQHTALLCSCGLTLIEGTALKLLWL